jgi:lipoyl-dependent peroxiredoxin
MPTTERHAVVTWTGDLRVGQGQVSVGSNAFPSQQVTFPGRVGEDQRPATTPEELIAAAHASCYAMALSGTLGRNGTPAKRLEVRATCLLDIGANGLRITRIDLDVKGVVDGMGSAEFESLAMAAEEACPVSNALRNNVEVRVMAETVPE